MSGLISSERLLFSQAIGWLEQRDAKTARCLRSRLAQLLEVERVASTFPLIRPKAGEASSDVSCEQILSIASTPTGALGPLQLPPRTLMSQSLRVARIQLLRVVQRALADHWEAPVDLLVEVRRAIATALYGRIYNEVLLHIARSPDLGTERRLLSVNELIRRWDESPNAAHVFYEAVDGLWRARRQSPSDAHTFLRLLPEQCEAVFGPVKAAFDQAGPLRDALLDFHAGAPRRSLSLGPESGLTAVDEDFECPTLALPLDPQGHGAEEIYRSYRVRQRASELESWARPGRRRAGPRPHPAETWVALEVIEHRAQPQYTAYRAAS